MRNDEKAWTQPDGAGVRHACIIRMGTVYSYELHREFSTMHGRWVRRYRLHLNGEAVRTFGTLSAAREWLRQL